ncbi:MAG: glyoxalase/bleomycin resistance/extradiol dioxygenase family protein [Calditrichia bacterium]
MPEIKNLQFIVPVFPSADIARDLAWYEKHTGFVKVFGDTMYAGLKRDGLELHLQWHADTEDDPLLGGSVIRIFVQDIQPLFDEFVQRGTVSKNKLRMNTDWGTHEFGFYDLNKNGIFIVQDV